MTDFSTFTLIAAAIALVINLAKTIPAVKTFLVGRERMASVLLGVGGAYIGRHFGWLEIAGDGGMALVTTGAALSAASGVAYEQVLKAFGGKKPSTKERIEELEKKTATVAA